MQAEVQAQVCVFVGPTLPAAEVRELLPQARVLAPARGGDVYRAFLRHRPRIIALIDGLFEQTASVYHKELLYVMSRGVWVYGASSMGALRACECAPFGMIGVGDIYRRFASGEYMDDDEVAVSHAAAEQGHRSLSEAMVSLRVGLQRASEAGLLEPSEAAEICAQLKQLYYGERSWPSLLAIARRVGVAPKRVEALAAFVERHRFDQKRADALELIGLLADKLASTDELPAFEPDFDFVASSPWEAIKNRIDHEFRGVRVGDDWVPFERIKNHVLLFQADFDVQLRLSQALSAFAKQTRCLERPEHADRLYWMCEGQGEPAIDPELEGLLSPKARRDAVAIAGQLDIEHAIHELPAFRPADMIPLQLVLREELLEVAEEVARKWRGYEALARRGEVFDDEQLLASFADELDSPIRDADLLATTFSIENGATLLEELRARAAAERSERKS